METTKDTFELSIDKVSKSIKSCKNYNQVISCESLLNNFKVMFENDTDDEDFNQTCIFLESQLNVMRDKFEIL